MDLRDKLGDARSLKREFSGEGKNSIDTETILMRQPEYKRRKVVTEDVEREKEVPLKVGYSIENTDAIKGEIMNHSDTESECDLYSDVESDFNYDGVKRECDFKSDEESEMDGEKDEYIENEYPSENEDMSPNNDSEEDTIKVREEKMQNDEENQADSTGFQSDLASSDNEDNDCCYERHHWRSVLQEDEESHHIDMGASDDDQRSSQESDLNNEGEPSENENENTKGNKKLNKENKYLQRAKKTNCEMTSENAVLLVEAILSGNLFQVDTLCKCSLLQEIQKDRLLLLAVERNQVEIARRLMQWGASATRQYRNHRSLLISAVRRDNLEMVRLLVEAGHAVNYETDFVSTDSVLICAVRQYNLEIIKYLIEKGAQINIPNKAAKTAMYLVRKAKYCGELERRVEGGTEKRAAIRAFLQSKGGISVNMKLARNIRQLEVVNAIIQGGTFNQLLHILSLIKAMPEPFPKASPLWTAVKHGKVDMARLLVLYGANINEAHSSGDTLMHAALHSANDAVVQTVLDAGFELEVNRIDRNGDTLLHSAVKTENWAFVRILVAKGADVAIRDKRGRLALSYSQKPFSDCDNLLLMRPGMQLMHAVLNQNITQVASTLKSIQFPPNSSHSLHSSFFTVLPVAIQTGNVVLTSLLLEKEAFVAPHKINSDLLVYPVQKGNFQMVRILLKHGIPASNVSSVQFRSEKSPLFFAVQGNRLDIVKLLLFYGADMNYAPLKDLCPIRLARKLKFIDIRRVLISAMHLRKLSHREVIKAQNSDISEHNKSPEKLKQSPFPFNHLEGTKRRPPLFTMQDAGMFQGISMSPYQVIMSEDIPVLNTLVNRSINLNAPIPCPASLLSDVSNSQGKLVSNEDISCRTMPSENAMTYDCSNISRVKETIYYRPLDLAVRFNKWKSAQVLIRNGASLKPLKGEKSYLRIAIENGCLDMVRVIASTGTNFPAEKIKHHSSLANTDNNLSIHSSTQNPLFDAIRLNRLDMVMFLVAAGFSHCDRKSSLKMPLAYAKELGFHEIVLFLKKISQLKRQKLTAAQLQATYSFQDCRESVTEFVFDDLENAIFEQNMPYICGFLQSAVPIDVADDQGVTPLALAVRQDKCDIARVFIAKGANVNFHFPSGESLLHKAVFNGSDVMTQLLCDSGADVNSVDVLHRTPLHNAIILQMHRIERILTMQGARMDLKDSSGHTPEMYAVNSDCHPFNHNSICYQKWKKAYDFICSNQTFTSQIADSIENTTDSIEKTTNSIENTTDSTENTTDFTENTTAFNHFKSLIDDILHLRIGRQKCINLKRNDGSQSTEGDTLVHAAIKTNNLQMAAYLLDKGADLTIANNENICPLNSAISYFLESKNVAPFEFLFSKNTELNALPVPALHTAVHHRSIPMIMHLLSTGANLHAVDQEHKTALHIAIHDCSYATAKLLIRLGSNIHSEDCNGMSPLDYAQLRSEMAELISDYK